MGSRIGYWQRLQKFSKVMQEKGAVLVLTDSISRFLVVPNIPSHRRAPQFFSTGKSIEILRAAKEKQLLVLQSMYKISEGWLSSEGANKNL